MMGPDAGAIAQTIQLSVTPVFLLVATGSLLNVIAGRPARVVDRSRVLLERWADTEGVEHERVFSELRIADRRMRIINNSNQIGRAHAELQSPFRTSNAGSRL